MIKRSKRLLKESLLEDFAVDYDKVKELYKEVVQKILDKVPNLEFEDEITVRVSSKYPDYTSYLNVDNRPGVYVEVKFSTPHIVNVGNGEKEFRGDFMITLNLRVQKKPGDSYLDQVFVLDWNNLSLKEEEIDKFISTNFGTEGSSNAYKIISELKDMMGLPLDWKVDGNRVRIDVDSKRSVWVKQEGKSKGILALETRDGRYLGFVTKGNTSAIATILLSGEMTTTEITTIANLSNYLDL